MSETPAASSTTSAAPARAASWPRTAPFTAEQPPARPAGRVVTPYVRGLAAAAGTPLAALAVDPRRGRPTAGSVAEAARPRSEPAATPTAPVTTRCTSDVALPGRGAVTDVGLARLVVAAVRALNGAENWEHGSDVLVHRGDGRAVLLSPARDLGLDGVLRALSAPADRADDHGIPVGLVVHDLSGSGVEEVEVAPTAPAPAALTVGPVRDRPVAVHLRDGDAALHIAPRARLVLVASGVAPAVAAHLLGRTAALLGRSDE